MAKPKRTNNLNSKRPARPQQSEIHTPKPHRKGGAPESRATGKRSDAAQGYESEFQRDGSKERRTKKRWEDETPSVRAMREQIRDAAAKAAGHPPIRKHAKSSGSKSFEGQRPYGIDRPFEGRPTGRNHRDDDSSFEPRRGIRKLNASDSSFDPQSSGRNHRDDDRRFDSRPSGRGSRDMEAPRVEQSPVDAPKKALRPKHVKADEQPVAEAVVAVTPVAENAPETEQDNAASQGPTFDDLGLSDALRASVAKAGYETPTPIQAGGIPILLQGRDLIGQAQTGTGKTAAYALPAIQLVDPEDWSTQVIILAPTRELAVQVATETQDSRSTGSLERSRTALRSSWALPDEFSIICAARRSVWRQLSFACLTRRMKCLRLVSSMKSKASYPSFRPSDKPLCSPQPCKTAS
jgi:hypothetical protein